MAPRPAVRKVVVDGDMTPGHGQRQIGADQAQDLWRAHRVEAGVLEDRCVVHPPRQRARRLGQLSGSGRDLRVARIPADQADALVRPAEIAGHVDDDDISVGSEPAGNRAAGALGAPGDSIRAVFRHLHDPIEAMGQLGKMPPGDDRPPCPGWPHLVGLEGGRRRALGAGWLASRTFRDGSAIDADCALGRPEASAACSPAPSASCGQPRAVSGPPLDTTGLATP